MNAIAKLALAHSAQEQGAWLPVEEDRRINGWRPVVPIVYQPCGNPDCRAKPRDYSPNNEPMRLVQPDEDYRPETVAVITASIERRDRELSRHEGFHTLVALAVGCDVIEVQISGQPFCRHTGTDVFDHEILITIAGEVAEGTPEPSKEQCLTYLRKVSEDTCGKCDGCDIATTLRQVAPPEKISNDTLALAWLHYWNQCAAFLAIPDVSSALDRIAAELFTRRRMTGEEIAALVNAEALKAAYASIKSK
jgi:hypothetical protein